MPTIAELLARARQTAQNHAAAQAAAKATAAQIAAEKAAQPPPGAAEAQSPGAGR